MPFLSNSVFLQNMRMTDMILHELAIKTSCKFNPEKDNLKEISKDSMQCLVIHDKKETTDIEAKSKVEADNIVNKTFSKIQQNFIPYPDHNYGQQPPLTPPLESLVPIAKVIKENSILKSEVVKETTNLKSEVIKETSNLKSEVIKETSNLKSELIKESSSLKSEVIKETSSLKSEGTTDQEGVTKCICGFDHDDGYMICCDKCSSWQHIECMGIKSSKVPKKYSCYNCSPRELDIKRAKEIQTKKRENMSEEDDEEDDEAEESCSEEEASKAASYTIKYSNEVSNTPTRITLQLSNSNVPVPTTIIKKGKKGGKFGRKKTSDQRPSRRKTRRKEKSESIGQGDSEDAVLITDAESFNAYLSTNSSYESINNNKCDEELKNMHFKLPEVAPSIDFENIVKTYEVLKENKGLVSTTLIPSGSFIVECVGTLMSLRKFNEQNPYFQQNLPYVIKYSKIEQFPVVIDARKHGNEARFIRRSCCANSELKHLTVNGSLHIMVISVIEILKDQEITVPFDQDTEYPRFIDCACGQENCPLMKANVKTETIVTSTDPPKQTVNVEGNQAINKASDMNDQSHESEGEGVLGEDGRHEKLSREERKLQAYMKQFEKLEKKQDATKKGKDVSKPTILKSADEQMVNNALGIKPPLVKKLSGKRKSMSINGKRRTRQSSCSSEPVSPAEQEHNSAASTPTNSLVVTSCGMTETLFSRQRLKKDKEPLTLTLPIQRKLRNENSLSSPTPPCTPSIEVSPVSEHSNLSLTVDTQLSLALESTPVKTSNLGLLQIARHSNGYSSQNTLSTSAHPTSEEKIGNLLLRNSGEEHVPLPSPYGRLPQSYKQNRKYYGSLKKHWLRKHVLEKRFNVHHNRQQQRRVPINGETEQICLAALMATLDPTIQQQNVENSTRIFKQPKNYVPLKKRHVRRALQKMEIQKKLVEESKSQIEQLEHRTITSSSKQAVTDSSVSVKNTPITETNEVLSKNVKHIGQLNSVTIEAKPDTVILAPEKKSQTLSSISEQKNDNIEIKENGTTHVNESIDNIDSVSQSLNVQAGTKRTFDDFSIDMKPPDVKKSKLSPKNTIPIIAIKYESIVPTTIEQPIQPITIETTNASTVNTQQTLYEPKCESTEVTLGTNVAHHTEIEKLRTFSNSSSLTSPRTSIDSNPDFENTPGSEGNPATVKRKLSIKDYRNRRSQKVVIPSVTSTSSIENNVTSTLTSSIINQAADTLLTPKTLSLCGPQSSSYTTSLLNEQTHTDNTGSNTKKRIVLNTIEPSSKRTENINSPNDNSPSQRTSSQNSYETTNGLTVTVNNDENIAIKKADTPAQQQSMSSKRPSNDRNGMVNTSVFEPVSPINDEPSKEEQQNVTAKNTIHTEITKNPFTIHNNITKHPFSKQQNQGPGLLQYLSAQKYPHLATITNNSNTTTNNSNNTISPNPDYHRSPHQHNTEYHNMVHDNITAGENDEDTSSNHSSISSTSFGSGDMLHDRSHTNYHRSTTAPSGGGAHGREAYVGRDVRDFYSHNNYGSNSYYPSYQTFNQQQQPQQQQQQQHPQTNRQPNSSKRNHSGFIQPTSTNAYTPQGNQALRRLQPHNRFHHY